MILTTGQPFWLTERGLVRYPVLAQDEQCDAVIVGGGISGVMLGYYLTQAGLRAVLLEERYVGGGSTSASTAMLQYELDENLVDLRKKVGIPRANEAYLANLYGVHGVARLCQQELPQDCSLRYCHSLYLASSASDVASLEEEGDARRGIGIEAEFLGEAELLRRFQLKSPAALYSADTAEVNPYELTHTLLNQAQAAGLRVYERTAAQRYEVSPDGQRVTVHTAGGHTVQAGHVVVCTGFAAADLVPKDIVNLHSTYVVLSQPGQADALPTGDAQLWETARPYLYTRRTPDGRIMVGGRDEVIKQPTFQNAMLETKADKLEKQFRELFAQPIAFTRDFVWAGVYGETADSLPYIGQHPDFPRAWFALGYGGNGTTYSLLAAEIIRDALTGRQHRYAGTFGFEGR
ncbi:FAD-binding oxidoreductase [Hymenobacter sp. J193]|uniref:NAD(P)/FAD-dependent oxidoreductase n=1 Tax=Hymenobacter sp. J193 TaxID=2898429 RepID=UPI00215079C3|nr:FAD-dependent oxidoreductase [Hymenobacter sp. J193]MCR5888804.1 FAD-binding oxidoreductase [Hymenobacter sp. J193]